MFKWLFRSEPDRTAGNEQTGDLTLKHKVLHIERVDGNWVYGCVPGMECYFSAKVHAVPSRERRDPQRERGINGGRISRLWISKNEEEVDPLVNFELGSWIVAPKAEKERTVLYVLLESWA